MSIRIVLLTLSQGTFLLQEGKMNIILSSSPNKLPYRISLAQQEEIMAQVNELVEKGMVRPSSSTFCSLVLLVQKKDGSYHMCGLSCAKQEY